jgi:hypothetical protein
MINDWLQRRKEPQIKVEIKNASEYFLNPEMLEFVQNQIPPIVKYYAESANEKPLDYLFSFNLNVLKQDQAKALAKSESIYSTLQQAIVSTQQQIISSLENLAEVDLQKAIKPEHFKRLKDAHDPIGQSIVNHKQHIDTAPSNIHFKEILSASDLAPEVKSLGGISRKAVYKATNNDTYMMKPYHKKRESGLNVMQQHPITGWASIATRNLFHASGMGHLCEDVSAYTHEDLPMTVHKFRENMQDVKDVDYNLKNRYNFNPNSIHKIAVMDFLTNNTDRHGGNILIHRDPDSSADPETGYHEPLAIDHERNFQYKRPIKATTSRGTMMGEWKNPRTESPVDYMKSHGIRSLIQGQHHYYAEELADWWNEHHPKIQASFSKDIEAIQDPHIREHVRNNFQSRMDYMHKWTSDFAEGFNPNLNETMNSETGNGVRALLYHKPRAPKFQKIAEQLSAMDPINAVHAMADWVNNKSKITPQDEENLRDLNKDLIKKLDPKSLAHMYDLARKEPKMQSKAFKTQVNLSRHIINHVIESNSKAHIKALLPILENGNDTDKHRAKVLKEYL